MLPTTRPGIGRHSYNTIGEERGGQEDGVRDPETQLFPQGHFGRSCRDSW